MFIHRTTSAAPYALRRPPRKTLALLRCKAVEAITKMSLPTALYSAAQVRELDRLAIEGHGIAGGVLMARAGQALFQALRARYPRVRRPVIVCGTGNNGGDGFVLARLMREAGLAAEVRTVGDSTRITGDALAARSACTAAGVTMAPFEPHALADCDAVVDALLGTGLEREVADAWHGAIASMNALRAVPVLAVDIPSGLHADTGRVMGAAVRAQLTMTFIGLKAGLFTGYGREHCGDILFDDLEVPDAVYQATTPVAQRLLASDLHRCVRARTRHTHKGETGHVLVVGGARGMAGAARLAGEAAYRTGAGLVTVATDPAHAPWLSAARPELLSYGVADAVGLRALFARASVIALGPGLGQGSWSRELFSVAIETEVPLVVDADGLNLLVADPVRRDDWVLTPHPGEAARLLGVSTHKIQADRFAAARAIAARYGGVVVLKGSGTLVVAAEEPVAALCDRGNPGMASGGMGDVLTGVIAALRAQGLAPWDAARVGVWLHATAADDAVRGGNGALTQVSDAASNEIGLIASDLFAHLRTRMNILAGDVHD